MRHEFPRSIKVAVIKRATVNYNVMCEKCGLPTKKFQIDHVVADAIGGKPVIENAELICQSCYSVKNPDDTRKAAKTKRVEAKSLGVKPAARRTMQSPGFPEKPAKAEKLSIPPRRSLYRSI